MQVLDFTQTHKQITTYRGWETNGGAGLQSNISINKQHIEGGKPMEVLDFTQTHKQINNI